MFKMLWKLSLLRERDIMQGMLDEHLFIRRNLHSDLRLEREIQPIDKCLSILRGRFVRPRWQIGLRLVVQVCRQRNDYRLDILTGQHELLLLRKRKRLHLRRVQKTVTERRWRRGWRFRLLVLLWRRNQHGRIHLGRLDDHHFWH